MLDIVSMFSDELMEAILEENVTEEMVHNAVRTGTLSRELTPVYIGSAYKNVGVQPLLSAVINYLPSPVEVENIALDTDEDEKEVVLSSSSDDPTVALAFKPEVTPYGQLTYLRIYQGCIEKGSSLVNIRSKKKVKVGRLVRMHSDQMEDITKAEAGDIVALFGIDCFSGDTFTDGSFAYSMTSIFVPEPVISLSIKPKDNSSEVNMGKAIHRFVREDPTFRSFVDPESNETIISGMGELHLDVYVERMKREFSADVETGMPQVAYREAVSKRADFDYIHKKQTGGSGQYGRVVGFMEPSDDGIYEFVKDRKSVV